ncbi:hypothetical protein J2T55_002273 [Methylohalomonas lacus]|uniref:Amidoligase enzyme n=1 Tax=Methylohalomonas lacus TaxID=398773 RepID=A0AAE3HN24_9GAMM|nr:amidoligase family protein [Methylohalomonas lacus]MCS3904237.1 hypothetical protein [Methylohalomonas lacus]
MTEFIMPPVRYGSDGHERRVGYEIEYAGVDIDASADIVHRLAGGTLEKCNPFHYEIRDSAYGRFSVEIDASLLHEQEYEKYLDRTGIDLDQLDLRAPLEKLLRSVATIMVPHEIVTPPLALSDMHVIDDIRAELVKAEARGTRESVLYGFGVHLNPELPDTGATSLLAHLRAYCLLYDWICRHSKIDWSRRVGPYINRYPDDYIDLIMQVDYAPNRSQLADDYVRLVPSRNHALDMLPALVALEGDRLLTKVKEPALIKPRPAFHYRLPNCLIGDPDWRVADEWNTWVRVEKLAANAALLEELMQAYRRYRGSWFTQLRGDWPEQVDAIISDL